MYLRFYHNEMLSQWNANKNVFHAFIIFSNFHTACFILQVILTKTENVCQSFVSAFVIELNCSGTWLNWRFHSKVSDSYCFRHGCLVWVGVSVLGHKASWGKSIGSENGHSWLQSKNYRGLEQILVVFEERTFNLVPL